MNKMHEVCRAIDDARYNIAVRALDDRASIICIMSYHCLGQIKRELEDMSLLVPCTGNDEGISIYGCKVLLTSNLADGEFKVLVSL